MVRRSVDEVPDYSLSGFTVEAHVEMAALEAEESARHVDEICEEIERDLVA